MERRKVFQQFGFGGVDYHRSRLWSGSTSGSAFLFRLCLLALELLHVSLAGGRPRTGQRKIPVPLRKSREQSSGELIQHRPELSSIFTRSMTPPLSPLSEGNEMPWLRSTEGGLLGSTRTGHTGLGCPLAN